VEEIIPMEGKPRESKILKFHDQLCKGCYWVGGVMLFIMAFTVSYDVFMRYFFTRPTSWSIDFAEYILLYSTFLAAAWLLKMDGHVKVTVLHDKLGKKAQLVMDIINSVIGAMACVIMTWVGAKETVESYLQNVLIIRPVTVPKWVILWVIPFGFFLFFTYFIRNIFSFVSQLRSSPATEPEES
jgi:C4-dicarboxylate transporter, DctQ subunit